MFNIHASTARHILTYRLCLRSTYINWKIFEIYWTISKPGLAWQTLSLTQSHKHQPATVTGNGFLPISHTDMCFDEEYRFLHSRHLHDVTASLLCRHAEHKAWTGHLYNWSIFWQRGNRGPKHRMVITSLELVNWRICARLEFVPPKTTSQKFEEQRIPEVQTAHFPGHHWSHGWSNRSCHGRGVTTRFFWGSWPILKHLGMSL